MVDDRREQRHSSSHDIPGDGLGLGRVKTDDGTRASSRGEALSPAER